MSVEAKPEVALDARRKKTLVRQLWTLSYPSILAYTLQGFYDIVDMVWVGRVSKEAMAGVTLFSTIYMLFGVLNEVAGTSSVSMISQSYGRGETERTRKISEQTISFKVVLALITGLLLAIFLRPILDLYTDDPLVMQAALEYGTLRIFFTPLAFASYSCNTIFRCQGDSKTPMIVMIIAAVTNIVLDPLLMFETIPGTSIPGFNLGVLGASLATCISIALSLLVALTFLLTGKRGIRISWQGLFRLDKKIDRELLSIGLPAGMQLMVRQAFNALVVGFITSYGTTAVTVYGLGNKLASFAFTLIIGFSFSGSTLVGHALGREREDEAHFVARVSTIIMAGMIWTLALLTMIFPHSFIALFNKEWEVLEAGTPMLRWMALALMVASLSAGMRVAFSGSGYNRPLLISTLISRWGVQLTLMFLMVKILALPLATIWISFFVAEIADLSVVTYYYKRGDWLHKRV